jgi:PKD repeat protein
VRIVSAYVCQPYNYKGKTNYLTSRSNHAHNGVVNPPLNADFNASPLSGNSPLTVQFTDVTAGNPNSWLWYFGDGDTSNQASPSHTYTANGKYTVKLVVSDGSSTDSIEKVDFITVGSIGFDDIDLSADLRIYPNPLAQNKTLFVDYQKVKITDVELLDIVGKHMEASINRTNGRIEIQTGNLSGGVYVLKLQSAAGDVLIRKIIIQ